MYVAFCESFRINSLPVSEDTLCYYVACLGQQGLAHSSIRTYLSGVRKLWIAHGFKDINYDEIPGLRRIIEGVHIDQGRKCQAPHRHLPITPLILRKMKSVIREVRPWWSDTLGCLHYSLLWFLLVQIINLILTPICLLKTWLLITLQLHPWYQFLSSSPKLTRKGKAWKS